MDLNLITIKKNDKYYVRHKTESYFSFENMVFNTEQLSSFSKNWLVFGLLPTQIQRRTLPMQKCTGYTLKAGFATSDLTPFKMPADAFEYLGDDDYKNNNIRGLYEPEYESIPERFEDIKFTFEVIDEDCEPLLDPKYPYISDFPFFIDNHEAVRHKYPCHIKKQAMFDIIKVHIKKNLPAHCKITSDYDFHFCVELIIPVLHEETYQKDTSGLFAKKHKYVTAPLRSIPFKIIDLGLAGERDNYGTEKISGIHANNYAELEASMDAWLKRYSEKMEQKLTVCPHCKGYGFQEVKA